MMVRPSRVFDFPLLCPDDRPCVTAVRRPARPPITDRRRDDRPRDDGARPCLCAAIDVCIAVLFSRE